MNRDSWNSNWYIKELKKSGGHPIMEFLQMGVLDIIKNEQHLSPRQGSAPSFDSSCVYVYEVQQTRILAAVQFERTEWNRAINIGWAYVLPEFRRCGMHSMMIARIEQIAKNEGYGYVNRDVNVKNVAMLSSIQSQGYKERYVRMSKCIISDDAMIIGGKDLTLK